ncbi:type VI secretion protein IcmF/TssM N-terminal domain-containing protein [Tautonia marina]|uniref:type VI secretion protein IcmF/TssM N-terminal domain-containing protein n=1 Tax=Tautonia marina TaxID=2653855 RepID=UPI001260B1B2|nr:type VI secretion protein IcmF/TssM N-terminal domain-containing protein [Tautonia marina]
MLSSLLWNKVAILMYGVVAFASAGAAMLWSKHPVRWILVLAIILLAIGAFGPWQVPEIDPQLPAIFSGWALRTWLFGLGVIALLTTTHLIATLVRHARGTNYEKGEGRFPDLDAAWQEIVIRLGQAGIDPSRQRLYLLLGPDERQAAALIDSANVQLFGRAPSSPEAPIHAYAVADGILLSCAGASSFGRSDGEGPDRLAHLCRLIRQLNPEEPVLRGVAALLPISVAGSGNELQVASAIRNDLNAIRSGLRLRCPTYTVFTEMETVAGFDDFVARIPANLRQSRCGFSIPGAQLYRSELISIGIGWMRQWFNSWSLDLMVQEIRNKNSNNRLMLLNNVARRNRDQLIHLLDACLSTHEQSEPVLFRGCYFVSNGVEDHQRAFAMGLVAGRNGRLLVDHALTTWSREAERLNARYRAIALGLAVGAAVVALPFWYFGIIIRLAATDQSWIGWTGLAGLVLIWIIVLSVQRLRRPRATSSGTASVKAGNPSAA